MPRDRNFIVLDVQYRARSSQAIGAFRGRPFGRNHEPGAGMLAIRDDSSTVWVKARDLAPDIPPRQWIGAPDGVAED